MFFNTRLKSFRIVSKICLVGCTFVSINSTDADLAAGLGGFFGNLMGNAGGGDLVLRIARPHIFIRVGNDQIPSNFSKPNVCILFHGLRGNAQEIKDGIGVRIADKFNCDVISLEYNYFDINNINASVDVLVQNFINLYNNKNLENCSFIVMGYSLGVNVALLFAIKLKRDHNINLDFIGYKGYKDLYSVIRTDDGMAQDFLKAIPGAGVEAACSFVQGLYNSDANVKQLIDSTDNLTSIKNLGLDVEIINEGLAEGHDPDVNDIDVIHAEYEKLKNGDHNNHFILLCQAKNDNVVGNGMQEVYNALKRTGTDDTKKNEEEGSPGACDCYSKCSPNSNGSQSSKSSTQN